EVLHVGFAAAHPSRDRAEGLDERVDASVVFAVLEDVGQERVREFVRLAGSQDVPRQLGCPVVVRRDVRQYLFGQGRLAGGGELGEGDAEAVELFGERGVRGAVQTRAFYRDDAVFCDALFVLGELSE